MIPAVNYRDFRVERRGDGSRYPPFDDDPMHARAEMKAERTGLIFYTVGMATKEAKSIVKSTEILAYIRNNPSERIHWIAFPPRIGDKRYRARDVKPSFVFRFKGSV